MRAAGVRRAWLVTTNDNLDALGFYQRRGWHLSALSSGAVDEARREIKPSIGEIAANGIAIRDELELTRPRDVITLSDVGGCIVGAILSKRNSGPGRCV